MNSKTSNHKRKPSSREGAGEDVWMDTPELPLEKTPSEERKEKETRALLLRRLRFRHQLKYGFQTSMPRYHRLSLDTLRQIDDRPFLNQFQEHAVSLKTRASSKHQSAQLGTSVMAEDNTFPQASKGDSESSNPNFLTEGKSSKSI